MSQIIPRWDQSLIERYDLSGPRYTSYPTAPQFRENFPAREVEAAINRSNDSGRPLSLYFHIPFCDTICYYCGCNKIITSNKSRARPYIELLKRELAYRAWQFKTYRPVRQLHWGGGTPTFISDDEMVELMQATREYFSLLEDDSGDYSIEVHPGRMSAERLGLLRKIGFNRLSMGVQDFDPEVQKAVNRYNSVEEVAAICQRARTEGFHSISMDLIYGLPMQNMDSVKRTLEQVIALEPDRLSLFNYAHMPHLFKTQRQIASDTLPAANLKLAMLEYATYRLQEAGYIYIGMDHFARPDDSLVIAQQQGLMQRNFQGYTTHGNCDLLAFGISSISAIDNIYMQNPKDMKTYTQAIETAGEPALKGLTLNEDDLLRQAVINQLICHFTLDFSVFEQRFNINFENYFKYALLELQAMIDDGLLTLRPNGLDVSTTGRLLIRRICMAFDAYLKDGGGQRYSRIV
ncbi:MAG: oxygen-independent coproporphyrinogen III oxidase [Parahaliea sp.]